MTTNPSDVRDDETRRAHPTAHAEGPLVDVRDMLVVHTALLREFRLGPTAVLRAAGSRDAGRSATRVATHLRFLCDLLHHHHHGEDALLWPPMVARATDEVRGLIARGEEQHEQLDALLARVRSEITTWVARPTEAAGHDLVAALEDLHQALDRHLDYEEQVLLPHAAALLTDAEWHAIGDAAVQAIAKPQLPLVFGMFAYEGDPAVLRTMLAQAPAVPRVLLPRIAPRVYARRAAQLYGTRTP